MSDALAAAMEPTEDLVEAFWAELMYFEDTTIDAVQARGIAYRIARNLNDGKAAAALADVPAEALGFEQAIGAYERPNNRTSDRTPFYRRRGGDTA